MPFQPLVLIPSYNTGGTLLRKTVVGALEATSASVWVVLDGSTDDSIQALEALGSKDGQLKVIVKDRNEGKGAAVRSGLKQARLEGYTHALVMDADGQHPAERIEDFFAAARREPEAMVLGQPIFDESVPLERLYGRQLSVWLVRFEVAGKAIGDPLYGFRVYPIEALLEVMAPRGRSNRYDFDPEVAVRLNWMGVPSVKIDSKVAYLDRADGGVSHFHYLRDNVRFVLLHTRLLVEAPFRLLARPRSMVRKPDTERHAL